MNRVQLEQCIQEYGTDLYTFCSRITENRQEAEDLYQDTFLKALELENRIDYNRNPRSYLLSIALRIWKNRKRKFAWRRRIAVTCGISEETMQEASIVQEASTEETVLQMEIERQVRELVGKLSDRYRVPVYLYYIHQFSIEEISGILGIPQGTVKSRLHKARSLLKQELEAVYDEI